MPCKNLCEHLNIRRTTTAGAYAEGYRYCKQCMVFIKTGPVTIMCPCCHTRTKGRRWNHTGKERAAYRLENPL